MHKWHFTQQTEFNRLREPNSAREDICVKAVVDVGGAVTKETDPDDITGLLPVWCWR